MNEEVTIYDITSIPYFAYSPGLKTWGLIIVLGSALIACLKILEIRSKKHRLKAFSIAAKTMEDLKAAPGPVLTKQELSLVSTVIKRFLSFVLGNNENLSSMTEEELKAFQKAPQDQHVASLLNLIVSIDSIRYQKAENLPGAFDRRRVLDEILASIRKLEEAAANPAAK